MTYEELIALLETIKLPTLHCDLEITHPHCVLSEGSSRTLLGEDSCKSNVLGRKDDRVLIMFCCDT